MIIYLPFLISYLDMYVYIPYMPYFNFILSFSIQSVLILVHYTHSFMLQYSHTLVLLLILYLTTCMLSILVVSTGVIECIYMSTHADDSVFNLYLCVVLTYLNYHYWPYFLACMVNLVRSAQPVIYVVFSVVLVVANYNNDKSYNLNDGIMYYHYFISPCSVLVHTDLGCTCLGQVYLTPGMINSLSVCVMVIGMSKYVYNTAPSLLKPSLSLIGQCITRYVRVPVHTVLQYLLNGLPKPRTLVKPIALLIFSIDMFNTVQIHALAMLYVYGQGLLIFITAHLLGMAYCTPYPTHTCIWAIPDPVHACILNPTMDSCLSWLIYAIHAILAYLSKVMIF